MSGVDFLRMLLCDLVFLAHSFPLWLIKVLVRQLESWEYSKQIHDGEDDDPDNVNEVPVECG